MHRITLIAVVSFAVAGCGGGQRARPVASASAVAPGTATPAPAAAPPAARLWSVPAEGARAPLACPVASSHAAWPDRVLALPDGKFAALAERQPQLAEVTADGRVLARTPLGTRGEVWSRVLACGRDGRLAAAWIEEQGERRFRLRAAVRTPDGVLSAPQTVAGSGDDPYDAPALDGVALAFGPDGSLLVVYALDFALRAVVVSSTGALGRTVTLGKTNEITLTAAEIASTGRAIVAWTTIDGGEERNSARRVYAVTRAPEASRFGARVPVDRARVVDNQGFVGDPESSIRLSLAPDGCALLLWGMVTAGSSRLNYRNAVRVAEATPNGRFGPPRRLEARGIPGDVALRADGTALAVWRGYGHVRAAVHRPGERFGEPEVLRSGTYSKDLTAAFGPDGRPRVEWQRLEDPRVKFSVRRAP